MFEYQVIEIHGCRWYVRDGVYYPSVSTIINWKKNLFGRYWRAGDAANCGTGIHFQIQKYIFDKWGIGEVGEWPIISIWNMPEDERRYKLNRSMQMWFQFLRDHPSFTPIAQEMVIFNDELGVAGRIDQYNEIENKKILLDVKTGGYWPEYDLQAGGYDLALRSIGIDVDEVWLLFLDAKIERNPIDNYQVLVFKGEQRKQNADNFKIKVEEYYNNPQNVYTLSQSL